MNRDAGGETLAAVQSYVRYLQRLGVTELPVTLPPPVRARTSAHSAHASAAGLPTQTAPPEATPAIRLAQLAATVRDCRQCGLHRSRTQVVFGTGDPAAALVFVGEAPGHDEDIRGEPFVGPAGQLLTRIIAAIGLTREHVYLLNVIKCRPPQNRNPQPDEIAACRPILQAQLACLQPRVLCALGTFAAQTLLQTEERISRLRGRFHRLGDLQVMPTYHPAFLLRNPQHKRAVWEDMQLVQRALGLR
jgi:DNA polymerase